MGSEDTYHQEHPESNLWMSATAETSTRSPQESSVLERLSAISKGDRSPARARTVLSAQLIALGKRLGLSIDELVARIPEDTRRRTKYPVRIADDGPGLSFEHDLQIVEGPRGLTHR